MRVGSQTTSWFLLDEHSFWVSAAAARLHAILIDLFACCAAPLVLRAQVDDSDLLTGTSHILKANLTGRRLLFLTLIEDGRLLLYTDIGSGDLGGPTLCHEPVMLSCEGPNGLTTTLAKLLLLLSSSHLISLLKIIMLLFSNG